MNVPIVPALLLLGSLALPACGSGSSPGTRFDPPSTEFAANLGLATPPPVTREQAMAIAAEAAGGTATAVDQETEGGEVLYEVVVQTGSGPMEVEVRASDGGVVEMEPAD